MSDQCCGEEGGLTEPFAQVMIPIWIGGTTAAVKQQTDMQGQMTSHLV